MGAYLDFPAVPAPLRLDDDAILATVLRAMGKEPLGRYVSVQTHVFAQLVRVPAVGDLAGTFTTAGSTRSAYRYPHASAAFWRGGAMQGQVGLDRLFLTVNAGRFSGSVGRFPVNHSVTSIFTPNDFFAPFSATAINRLYKPGVDGLRMAVALGTLSSLEVTAALGFTPSGAASFTQSAFVARLSAVAGKLEWALLAGKVAQRFVVGGSVQGDIGPLGLRAEGHLGVPDRDGDGRRDKGEKLHGRLAVGPNVNFPWRSATLAVEYALFSDGGAQPSAYVARFGTRFPDDLPYLAQHYVALSGSLELSPLVRAAAVGLVNATDGSGMAGPFLVVNMANEADLIVGAYVPWGRGVRIDPTGAPALRSEFGAAPRVVYLESRFFF